MADCMTQCLAVSSVLIIAATIIKKKLALSDVETMRAESEKSKAEPE